MTDVEVWSGPVVTCGHCSLPCVPTYAQGFGYTMPTHNPRGLPSSGVPPCPASGARVDLPQHETTKRLRDQHIPEATGLTADENPMEGPSNG